MALVAGGILAGVAASILPLVVRKFVRWLASHDDDGFESTSTMSGLQTSLTGNAPKPPPRRRKHVLNMRKTAVDNGRYNIAFVGNVNCGKTSLFNAFLFMLPSDPEAGEVKYSFVSSPKRIRSDRRRRGDTQARDAYSPDLFVVRCMGLSG